jgi:cell division protein FtsA
MQSTYIALTIDSDYITAVAAQKNDEGQLIILESERKNAEGVKYGEIINPSEAGFVVKKTLELLENRINKKIATVYVGFNGRSLKTFNTTIQRSFPHETVITPFIMDDIKNEMNAVELESGKIYGIYKQESFVDNELEMNPIGCSCHSLDVNYRVVVGKSELEENLSRCFDRTGFTIANAKLQLISTAEMLLSKNEKEQGCVLVDFGTSCTSVVVYHHQLMRYLWVLPLGRRNIVRDIMSLNISNEIAEEIVNTFGDLHPASEMNSKQLTIRSGIDENQVMKVQVKMLYTIIEARMEEIVDAISKAIQRSRVADQLGSGLIISGNASRLKNLDLYLQQKLKMPVRYGSHSQFLADGTSPLYHDSSYSTIVSLLLSADQDCLYQNERKDKNKKEPKIKRKFDKFKERLVTGMETLFEN